MQWHARCLQPQQQRAGQQLQRHTGQHRRLRATQLGICRGVQRVRRLESAALSSAGCSTAEIKAWCAALPPLPKSLSPLAPAAAAAVARAAAAAGQSPPLARPALRELFGSNTTRALLKQLDTGDKLYELSGARLLARVEAELASAELIHNFGNPIPPSNCTASLNCGFDLELQNMPAVPDFYNQWTLQALELVPTDPLNNALPKGRRHIYLGTRRSQMPRHST